MPWTTITDAQAATIGTTGSTAAPGAISAALNATALGDIATPAGVLGNVTWFGSGSFTDFDE
jgi:hypothetical protein